MSPSLRARNTSRIEAFSDGVFAIAITLLVLNLNVVHGSRGQSLLAALGDEWPSFAAYLASFAYVGVVWVNHHWLFERIAAADSGVLWWNLAILLATATLPFPTALLAANLAGARTDAVVAVTIYALVVSLRSGFWFALNSHVLRHSYLFDGGVEPAEYRRRELPRAAVGVVLGLLAIPAAAFVHPYLGLVLFVIQSLFYAVTSEGLSRVIGR